MPSSRTYSFTIIAGFVCLSVICFMIVPSRLHAALLTACIALFCCMLLLMIRRYYLEQERMFKRSEDRIRQMAYYDDLTGLPNRRFFREQLEAALTDRRGIVALLSVDIDRFRLFNDTLGHDFGDLILLQSAERLTRCIAEGDVAARMEGDEFILLLRNRNRLEEIEAIAGLIHQIFDSPFIYPDYKLHTTVSIGVALHRPDDEPVDADTLIKHAGIALSRAKDQSNTPYVMYTSSLDIESFERLRLENELRRAIVDREFELYFQPQFDLATNRMVGVEALIRWNHPERGMVSPGKFTTAAEENGLITVIGDWVLSEACRQIKQLHSIGFRGLSVSVNLSSRQFLQQDLADRVAKVLQKEGLEAEYLELEITEGMTMDVESSIGTLRRLNELGVRISIDDFGTGYSSLNYLRKFPIHKLKIDRSFVRDLVEDPNDAAIVSTIISMAHHLGLKVIAEGVETQEQLSYLNHSQCNEIQGYLFCPPVPREELLHVLIKHA
mgnify:FL=1